MRPHAWEKLSSVGGGEYVVPTTIIECTACKDCVIVEGLFDSIPESIVIKGKENCPGRPPLPPKKIYKTKIFRHCGRPNP